MTSLTLAMTSSLNVGTFKLEDLTCDSKVTPCVAPCVAKQKMETPQTTYIAEKPTNHAVLIIVQVA